MTKRLEWGLDVMNQIHVFSTTAYDQYLPPLRFLAAAFPDTL